MIYKTLGDTEIIKNINLFQKNQCRNIIAQQSAEWTRTCKKKKKKKKKKKL
jgi:hypothetical protein